MRQVQKMPADMAGAQDELAPSLVEGSAGGGKVTAVVTGAGDVQTVRISSDVVDPDDVEMLEDLVVAAVGEAMRRAQELQAERMGAVTGGVDLGGAGPRPRRARRWHKGGAPPGRAGRGPGPQ